MCAAWRNFLALSMAYTGCDASQYIGNSESVAEANLLQLHVLVDDDLAHVPEQPESTEIGKIELALASKPMHSTSPKVSRGHIKKIGQKGAPQGSAPLHGRTSMVPRAHQKATRSEQPARESRPHSSKSAVMPRWRRCDLEEDVDVDQAASVVPDGWIWEDQPHDCQHGYRGRLLIDGGDKGAGFSTEFFLYMINHILFAERRCLAPVIIITCAGAPLWFDPISRENPWEWYFEPLTVPEGTPAVDYRMTLAQKTIMHQRAPWAVHSMYYCTGKDPRTFDDRWYLQMRSVGNRVVRQYFVVKPSLEAEVQDLWDTHFSGVSRVLGMHYRGGDKSGTYRVGRDQVDAYRDYAIAFLEAFPAGKIMLATDDANVEQEIMHGTWPTAVKKALVVPQGSTGLRKEFFVGMELSQIPSELRGKMVLFDILLLAKSDYLIYGQTTVAESVFYLNVDLHWNSIPIWSRGRPRPSRKWFLSGRSHVDMPFRFASSPNFGGDCD